MSDSNFGKTEIPTFPGYIVGIRALMITPSGHLDSPQQDHNWRICGNKASCIYFFGRHGEISTHPRYTFARRDLETIRNGGHQVAMQACTCGFYAYFHQRYADNYLPMSNGVYAIVKAYGRVTYGDQGFRVREDGHPRADHARGHHRGPG